MHTSKDVFTWMIQFILYTQILVLHNYIVQQPYLPIKYLDGVINNAYEMFVQVFYSSP